MKKSLLKFTLRKETLIILSNFNLGFIKGRVQVTEPTSFSDSTCDPTKK